MSSSVGGGEDATVLGATDDMKWVGDDGEGLADIVHDEEKQSVLDYVIKDATLPALKYYIYY